jgi:site-specific recombinase XerD
MKNNDNIRLSSLMKILCNEKLHESRLSKKQYTKNMKVISNISDSKIGKKAINNITPLELDKYFGSLIYCSNTYIQKCFSELSQVFSYAKKQGYIQQNPMTCISKDKFQRHSKICYLQKEHTNNLKATPILKRL